MQFLYKKVRNLYIKKGFYEIIAYINYVGTDIMENTLLNDEINQIRSSVNIVDIISGYIPLTPRGKNFFGVCPFHDDHSPSMSVSKEKQIYTCFTCGATGNVFKFVMNYENVSFLEAVNIVANKAGIKTDIRVSSKIKRDDKYKELYEIYDISQKLYRNNLSASVGLHAREYLSKRGIDADVIKEFGIGLSLKKNTMLSDFLIKKNFKMQAILKSGLVNQNVNGYYDMYYNRIMFPLWNLNGQVVGFSGRIYDTNDSSKYINTKETDIFKKGELLYNFHRAKDEARRVDTIIIMEGFMDVIRAYTVGIKNVVATMGTAVTKNQALLIKRMAKNVVLCFDGDSAGGKATMSCSEVLATIGVIPKVVRLEENLDPDEYIIKYGKDAFLNKLDNPINIMDFKLNYLKENKDLSNQVEYSNYIKEMLLELVKTDDDILISLTLNKISEESKLSVEFLEKQLNSLKGEKKIEEKPIINKAPIHKKNKYEIACQNLLYYMMTDSKVINKYISNNVYMPILKYQILAREICHFYNNNNYISQADMFTVLQNNDLIHTLEEITSLSLKDNFSDEEIDDYIHVIYQYNVEEQTKKLKLELKKEMNASKKALIAQKIMDLRLLKEREMEK